MRQPPNTNKAYYDPVHGVSLISGSERSLQSLWRDPDKYPVEGVFSICEAIEFKRLHFLRQAGFTFLTQPSANHTRFAHAIGTCHLGRAALDQVDIRIAANERIKLGAWLQSQPDRNGGGDLRDEFLLALLLHDIGHFPFSHVLESNPHLKAAGVPNHEEVAVDLILNADTSITQSYARLESAHLAPQVGAKYLHELLQDLEADGRVNRNAIAYLICRDRRTDLAKKIDAGLVRTLNLLGHLISGVVDIDRLDHYMRDLHFTGTAVAAFNVYKLLNAIYLDPAKNRVFVDEDAIPQAFNLLQAKEHLRRYVFNEESNVSFNAMLNYCVSAYLQAQGLGELKSKSSGPCSFEVLLAFTDDQLLGELESVSRPKAIRQMTSLIRMGVPYRLARHMRVDPQGKTLQQTADVIARQLGINYLEDELPLYIVFLEDHKGKVSLLNMNEIYYINSNGEELPLREAADFGHLIRHLVSEEREDLFRCWIFVHPKADVAERSALLVKLEGSVAEGTF